jgi:toluene monooxygenase system protein E
MNYHFRRQPAPFELSPDTPLNRWYLEHREGSALQADDWEGFRDPGRLIYRGYVALQHQRETVIDGLVDDFERREHDAGLDEGWVRLLSRLYVPMRFPIHALQMAGLYVGQMAPSSFIANAAYFQAADELRRVQWVAYRARSLAVAHGGDIGSSEATRRTWEDDPVWQPMREAVETMLVAYDWGEAFAALNLAVKPLFDALCNGQLAELARVNGDDLLALMLDQFELDAARSRDWSRALVAHAVDQRAENRDVLRGWVERWTPVAERGADALAGLFAGAPGVRDADEVRRSVRRVHRQHLEACGT